MNETSLIQLGVSPDQIAAAKTELLLPYPDSPYYEEAGEAHSVLVPVSKISGLGFRGEAGVSWWDVYQGKQRQSFPYQ